MKYCAADGGIFVDPETGELIAAGEMEEGNVHKDKGAGAEDAGTDKEALPGQGEG